MNELELKISNSQKHLSKIENTNSRFGKEDKVKLAKAAKEFESMLTQMMLNSMSKTTGGLLGEEGYGNDMFDSVFEQHIAGEISNSKSLGLAESIYKKVTGEDFDPELLSKAFQREKSINRDEIKIKGMEKIHGIKPSNGSLNRIEKFDNIIEEAAKEYGVNKNIIKSVIMTESAGNHKAVSSAKAKGLMQLMDSTASDLGVRNSFDPSENINGGTKYLAQMLRQYGGDLKLALAAYNAGPGNVDKYNGIPPFEETQSYITKVMGYINHFNKSES